MTYGCSGGPDTIEHVGSESNGDNNVLGVSLKRLDSSCRVEK